LSSATPYQACSHPREDSYLHRQFL
jgi:hypothetical protein